MITVCSESSNWKSRTTVSRVSPLIRPGIRKGSISSRWKAVLPKNSKRSTPSPAGMPRPTAIATLITATIAEFFSPSVIAGLAKAFEYQWKLMSSGGQLITGPLFSE